MSELETTTEPREPDAFEQALTQAMRRVDAPQGFAASVMDRAATPAAAATPATAPQKVLVMRSRVASLTGRAWVGGAIAAVLVLGVFGGEQIHARHERQQAALATRQFEAGVRITDRALAQTRAQLQHAGLNLGD